MHKAILFLSAAAILLGATNASVEGEIAAPLSLEQQVTKSGLHYTLFWQQTAAVDFVVERPSKANEEVLLCIPAAFTVEENNSISGVYGIDGKLHNKNRISHRVGGMFVIHPNGSVTIEGTNMGHALTDERLKTYEKPGTDCFQQIKIVSNGKAAGFKDKTLFQRRALMLTEDNRLAVIESRESCTLAQFSADIVELGAFQAAYVDMGAWDEGWYRNAAGEPQIIGLNRSQTKRQSNWVVFLKP